MIERHRTPQQELETLRLSIQRIAELTQDRNVLAYLPISTTLDRGWNRLCAALCDWVEEHRMIADNDHIYRPNSGIVGEPQ